MDRIREWGTNDNRGYSAKRKSLKTYLKYHIPEIVFQNSSSGTEEGSDKEIETVPPAINAFVTWMLASEREIHAEKRSEINRRVCTVGSNFIHMFLSDRQQSHVSKPSSAFRYTATTKHHIGMGLTIHQYTRDKRLIDLLSSDGLSTNYTTCLRYETALANAIIENMRTNGNIYVPVNLAKNMLMIISFGQYPFY